jgi:hypothetical protein
MWSASILMVNFISVGCFIVFFGTCTHSWLAITFETLILDYQVKVRPFKLWACNKNNIPTKLRIFEVSSRPAINSANAAPKIDLLMNYYMII